MTPTVHPLKNWLDTPDTGRSQTALAEAVGVSQSHISKIISGDRNCDPLLAEKISKATDGEVSVTDLIFFWRHQRQATRASDDAA